MRRLLSILLILAFGLGPIAFAIGYDDSGSLPACCRRQGAHHCAMEAQPGSGAEQTPAFSAPSHCPLFPADQHASPSSMAAAVLCPFAATLVVENPSAATATIFAHGAANRCTFTLRGPPALLSA